MQYKYIKIIKDGATMPRKQILNANGDTRIKKMLIQLKQMQEHQVKLN